MPETPFISSMRGPGNAYGDAERHSNAQNPNVTVRETFTLRATVATGELFGIERCPKHPSNPPKEIVLWCKVLRCGVVWRGLVRCGAVWCGICWCGVLFCGLAWRGAM